MTEHLTDEWTENVNSSLQNNSSKFGETQMLKHMLFLTVFIQFSQGAKMTQKLASYYRKNVNQLGDASVHGRVVYHASRDCLWLAPGFFAPLVPTVSHSPCCSIIELALLA